LPIEEFIRISIETNLFFQRIMKEHLFFIQVNLQPTNPEYIREANGLKQVFEDLLAETVTHANGNVSESAIKSGEFVTPYTLKAEEINKKLTGASLNTEITKSEVRLIGNQNRGYMKWLEGVVFDINARTLNQLKKVIIFQEKLITLVSECKIFIPLYLEMLKHDTHEAKHYQKILQSLQEKKATQEDPCESLNFWNDIMGEHAEFIDGMLDPTEKDLRKKARAFAKKFEKLVEVCIKTAERQILQESIEDTKGIIDFKRASTEGLLQCKIKSIIPPLLADHVLREANHYLRLLTMLKR